MINIAVDILLAHQILNGMKFSNFTNPKNYFTYKHPSTPVKSIYGKFGVKYESHYPEISIYIMPPYWAYHGKDDIGNTPVFDLMIIPKLNKMEPITESVKDDNIYYAELYSEYREYAPQSASIAEAIECIVRKHLDNDPNYLRSQLENANKTIADLAGKLDKLKLALDITAD